MTIALIRDGEYVLISGATTTEYAAQVAAVERPSRIPARLLVVSPPEPAATSPTPTADTSAATQKRRVGRSLPSASPRSAAKIGIAPRTRPIVDAVVTSSAKTNESWFSQSVPAASARTGRCLRSTRRVRSMYSVIATKMTPANA